MSRKQIYLAKEQEEYEQYNNDILQYQELLIKRDSSYILPNNTFILLNEMTEFSLFIDDIFDIFINEEDKDLHKTDKTNENNEEEDYSWIFNNNNNEENEMREETILQQSEYEEEEINIKDNIKLNEIISISWGYHNDIVNRQFREKKEDREKLTGHYAKCYFLSWGNFCRLFYLFIYNNKEKYELYSNNKAIDYQYCKDVTKENDIIFTGKQLKDYSITDIWHSIILSRITLYQYNYTQSMKEYIHALFFRYCTLISIRFEKYDQNYIDKIFDNPKFITETLSLLQSSEIVIDSNKDNDDDEEEDIDIQINQELFDGYKSSLYIEINDLYCIKSNFIFEFELIFFPQLSRLTLSSLINNKINSYLPNNNNDDDEYEITQRKSKDDEKEGILIENLPKNFLSNSINIWYKTISNLIDNNILNIMIKEEFKQTVSDIQLYHGEKIRFIREYPEASFQAVDILSTFRNNEYMNLQNLLKLNLIEIVKLFMEEEKKCINRKYLLPSPYEKESILLTKISNIIWFDYNRLKRLDDFKKSFIIEEDLGSNCTSFSINKDIDLIFLLHKRTNFNNSKRKLHFCYLIRLIRIYYIIDINYIKPRIFKTNYFTEAYIIWISVNYKHKLIEENMMPDELKKIIIDLNKLIIS